MTLGRSVDSTVILLVYALNLVRIVLYMMMSLYCVFIWLLC